MAIVERLHGLYERLLHQRKDGCKVDVPAKLLDKHSPSMMWFKGLACHCCQDKEGWKVMMEKLLQRT